MHLYTRYFLPKLCRKSGKGCQLKPVWDYERFLGIFSSFVSFLKDTVQNTILLEHWYSNIVVWNAAIWTHHVLNFTNQLMRIFVRKKNNSGGDLNWPFDALSQLQIKLSSLNRNVFQQLFFLSHCVNDTLWLIILLKQPSNNKYYNIIIFAKPFWYIFNL